MNRLKLLGGAAIISGEGPIEGRGVQRRRVALLALLALSRNLSLSREKIAALLWPESDSERARHQVSDSVYRINQAVGGAAVVATGDELRLDVALLPCDAVAFIDAVASADWSAAAASYGGPFLDGFFVPDAPEFERWVDAERARLAHDYVRSLEALAVDAEERGAPSAAVDFWRRAAVQDPHSSRIALRLMHALDAIGERPAAIKHARIHAELVHQDLGASPDAEVVALVERWRATPGEAKSPLPRTLDARSRSAFVADPEPASPTPASVALPTGSITAPRLGPPLTRASPVEAPPGAVPEAATYAPLGVDPQPSPVDRTLGEKRLDERRWKLVAAIVFVLVVSVGTIARLATRGTVAAGSHDEAGATIAVLPFANLSGNAANDYVSDGMTDELISTLAGVPGIHVASRTSAFAFKGTRLDVREIGGRLGVQNVLEGSVRRDGDRLRVAVHLVGARDGYQLWSLSFDRDADDVLAIQQEISRAVVEHMREKLGIREASLPRVEHPADDPQAYDLYLKGRFAWHQRNETGLRQAVTYFSASVAHAPRYARAWVGLGDAYAVLGFYDYLPPREAFPHARDAADRALGLDSTLGAPHATKGYVSLYHDWDFPVAEREFRQAIALDPAYSTAHQWYGNFLASRGRFAEAESEMRRAQELDPLSLIANAALGWVWSYQGRYDDAVAQYKRTLELNGSFYLAWLWMGIAESERGRGEDAQKALREAVRLSGGTTLTLAALARALALGGRTDSARTILTTLEARAAHTYLPSYELATAYLALGDRAAALSHLERALTDRGHSMVFLRLDPRLAALRGDVEFERLVEKVEEKQM